jgi:WD40 repeat protein
MPPPETLAPGTPRHPLLYEQHEADDSLHLEFVHGYRGYDDCCDNLFYTSQGEVVFHVAGVAVLYTSASHTQRFYFGHTDDILSLALHPSGETAATGEVGKDPAIKVWDVENTQTRATLKGQHVRGVCCLDFSGGDGKYLASIGLDDDHTLVLWEWAKEEMHQTVRCHKDRVFNIKFNPHDSSKLVSVGIKHIKFWTWTGHPQAQMQTQVQTLTGHRGAFGRGAMNSASENMHCVAFGSRADMCYTGSSSGFVYLWNGTSLSKRVEAHAGACYSLDFLDDIVASGGRDGVFKLWNESMTKCLKEVTLQNAELSTDTHGFLTQEHPPINAIDIGKGRFTLIGTRKGEVLEVNRNGKIRVLLQGHTAGELWGVAMHPTEPLVATVSEDKTLRIWDNLKHQLVRFKILNHKAYCCGFSNDGLAIAVGMGDGTFNVIDAKTMEDIIDFRDRIERITDIKFSPGGEFLAVASGENFVDIYSVFTSKRVGVCKGGSSYVTHVDWEENGQLLQLNTGAREHLFFEMPRGRRCVINTKDQHNIRWATMTCVKGDGLEGIWPPGCDVTDVNAAARSFSGSLLATGDDFGYVKLFRFPVRERHALHKRYSGHSSHVTNVRWSHDDCYLASTGGGDTALMIWRHTGTEEGF